MWAILDKIKRPGEGSPRADADTSHSHRVMKPPVTAATGHESKSAGLRLPQATPRLLEFIREHRLICTLVLVATVVRIAVLLAYPPGFWHADSLPYLHAAVQFIPYQIRPVGYSFFLILAEPTHSVIFLIALQHVMGLLVGAQVYALLHRLGLPKWAGTIAAIPPLLSATAIQIEHSVLSDALFCSLVTTALFLALWRPKPRLWICSLVGLILAWAALDRSQGILLIVPFLLYLVLARLRLRKLVVCAMAMGLSFAVPLIAYSWWFDQSYGSFEMTSSTGAFLYARVATFADCSAIKPPADERWLCPSTPPGQRQPVSWYVWQKASPLKDGPKWQFSNQVNHLATNFALRAISAQPANYLGAVWHSTIETFMPASKTNGSQNIYAFPSSAPESVSSLSVALGVPYSEPLSYNGGHDPSTRVVQPFAGWLRSYQDFVVLPGPLLGVIVLIGLLGSVLAFRRFGGAALLAWLVGAVLIVTAAATADYDARYVVASIPAFCIAAALGIRQLDYQFAARAPVIGTLRRARSASNGSRKLGSHRAASRSS